MTLKIVVGLIALVVGASVSYLYATGGGSPAALDASDSATRAEPSIKGTREDRDTATLNALRDRQRQLEDEVLALKTEIADIKATFGDGVQDSFRERLERPRAFSESRFGGDRPTPVENLMAAGFARDQAVELSRREDEGVMERLYLRNQAVREGWINTERYREALAELPDVSTSIRQELLPEDYDKYLFASGRPNRVLVNNVLQGSPAQDAGLKPGDVLLSFDGQAVFTLNDVQSLTAAGSAGSSVTVRVYREGENIDVSIPRGPLGITMTPRFADPSGSPDAFTRPARGMMGRPRGSQS